MALSVSVVVISRYLNQVVLIHTSKLSALLKFMPPNTHCLDMSEEPAYSCISSSGVIILPLTEQKLARWSSFSAKRDRKILIRPIKLPSQFIFQTQYKIDLSIQSKRERYQFVLFEQSSTQLQELDKAAKSIRKLIWTWKSRSKFTLQCA